MPKRQATLAVPVESRILILRHHRVILDSDLAELYGVPVKRLNEQVRRNRERFPADFMFRITTKEDQILRSQIATSSKRHGGRRYPPYAFTEHGAIMAATVLNSKRAIEMSVFVVRAFVRMREMLAKDRQLAAKINELDRRLETHDTAIQDLIEAIKELMAPEGTSKRLRSVLWQLAGEGARATQPTATCGAGGTASRLFVASWPRHPKEPAGISQHSLPSPWARAGRRGTAPGSPSRKVCC
jgi:phage regulator Rha-like protein